MSTTLWIILVFVIAAFCATFARLVFKQRTTLWVFILVDTKSLIKHVNRLAEKYKKALNTLSIFGIAVGFGPFGIDYLVKEKVTKKKELSYLFYLYWLQPIFLIYWQVGCFSEIL